MAHVTISFKKAWSKTVTARYNNWLVLEEWTIEDPYCRRRCGVQGCKRLIGHPEREVDKAMHADFDVTVSYEDRPGTFSMWPVKPSSWGLPVRARGPIVTSEGAIRGIPWRT